MLSILVVVSFWRLTSIATISIYRVMIIESPIRNRPRASKSVFNSNAKGILSKKHRG